MSLNSFYQKKKKIAKKLFSFLHFFAIKNEYENKPKPKQFFFTMGLKKNIIFGVMLGTHKMIQLVSQFPTWQIVSDRYVFPCKPTITSLPLTM